MEPVKEYVTIDNFKTISEFKECLIRGGEPMFEWNGIRYGVCFANEGYCIRNYLYSGLCGISGPAVAILCQNGPFRIGAYAFGPFVGVLVELVKNTLQLLSTSTGGVGELANFLIGVSFVFTAGLIYQCHKTKRTAWIAGIVGSIVMGIVAAAANFFILLPLFEQFMPIEQLIASFGEFIPFIHTKLDVVLFNAFPFNLLKGLVITIFTMLVYKRLRPVLKGAA